MSFTPNSAGTQEGGRGSGGGGGSRSAGKRRGKKRNNRQNADTSPPLPDLQAQTLFAPGTTGGAADEEIANQITLEEAKRIRLVHPDTSAKRSWNGWSSVSATTTEFR